MVNHLWVPYPYFFVKGIFSHQEQEPEGCSEQLQQLDKKIDRQNTSTGYSAGR